MLRKRPTQANQNSKKQSFPKKNQGKKSEKIVDQNDDRDESINSDDLPSDQEYQENNNKKIQKNNDENGEDEETYESADQKRIRLAKKFLQRVKDDTKKKDKQNDAFFQEGLAEEEEEKEEDTDSEANFQGVIRDDEITKRLQRQILSKKKKIFEKVADQINEFCQDFKEKGQIIQMKGHKQCITALEFYNDGKQIITVGKDAAILKWDIETQKKIVFNYGFSKDRTGHKDAIQSLDINYDGSLLITGGKDKYIKLWDLRSDKLIYTFKGHRNNINGVKFKLNSNEFCSVSADRTFKLWDATEKAYIDTYFGHSDEINYIDALQEDQMITCSFDRKVIIWKTQEESQLVYSGHDYSIDTVKALAPSMFITGSQDGSVALWGVGKKKPVYQLEKAHDTKWITSLGTIYNSDFFCSGSHNGKINLYKVVPEKRIFTKICELPSNGIVNDIKISKASGLLASIEGSEHKLGRWFTEKSKNILKLYRILPS